MRSQLTDQQLQQRLALLPHTRSCYNLQCSYPGCRELRTQCQHTLQRTQQASGGCGVCMENRHFYQFHLDSCTASDCAVPRCRWVLCVFDVVGFL